MSSVSPAPPDAPEPPPESPSPASTRQADATAAAVVVTACVVLGVPAGLVWAATAPVINVPAALNGAESAFDAQAGADIVFGAVVLVVGALCGGIAWWRAYRRGWLVPVALAVGGVGGALVASAIGHLRNSGQVLSQLPPGLSQRAQDVVDFGLRTDQVLALWPAAALLVYVVLTVGLTEAPPRRQRASTPAPEPEKSVSSG